MGDDGDDKARASLDVFEEVVQCNYFRNHVLILLFVDYAVFEQQMLMEGKRVGEEFEKIKESFHAVNTNPSRNIFILGPHMFDQDWQKVFRDIEYLVVPSCHSYAGLI